MFMRLSQRVTAVLLGLSLVLFTTPVYAAVESAAAAGGPGGLAWWWPLSPFFFCFGLGIFSVLARVGGGVFYVPLVSAFYPFHLDFVRCAGLFVAMSGALMAGPGLLKCGLAKLRLALPVALAID